MNIWSHFLGFMKDYQPLKPPNMMASMLDPHFKDLSLMWSYAKKHNEVNIVASHLTYCLWEQARSSIQKKVIQYIKTIIALVKPLKVVAKCCFNGFCVMGAFIVVLGTQM